MSRGRAIGLAPGPCAAGIRPGGGAVTGDRPGITIEGSGVPGEPTSGAASRGRGASACSVAVQCERPCR